MKRFVVSYMSASDAEPREIFPLPFTRKGLRAAKFLVRNYEALGIPARVDVRES